MAEHVQCRNNNDWAEWFLIHSIVEAEKQGNKVPSIPEGGMMVTLTINGVECPVIDTLRYLESFHDELIKKEAIKLLDDKFNDVYEILEKFKLEIKAKVMPDVD